MDNRMIIFKSNVNVLLNSTVDFKNACTLKNSYKEIDKGSPVQKYLNETRGLEGNLDGLNIKQLNGTYEQIHWDNTTYKIQHSSKEYLSAAIPMKDQYDNFNGLYLIKLDADGQKSTIEYPKLSLNDASKDLDSVAIVQQGNNTKKVYIAEGIETAASIACIPRIREKYTVLASLGVSKLASSMIYISANFPTSAMVVFLKDNDRTNQANKEFDKAVDALKALGFSRIVIKMPEDIDTDWNDLLVICGLVNMEILFDEAKSYMGYQTDDTEESESVDEELYEKIKQYKSLLFQEKKQDNQLQKNGKQVCGYLRELQQIILKIDSKKPLDFKLNDLETLINSDRLLGKLNSYSRFLFNYSIHWKQKNYQNMGLLRELIKTKPKPFMPTEEKLHKLRSSHPYNLYMSSLPERLRSWFKTRKDLEILDKFIRDTVNEELLGNRKKYEEAMSSEVLKLKGTFKPIITALEDLINFFSQYENNEAVENYSNNSIREAEKFYLEILHSNALSNDLKTQFQSFINSIRIHFPGVQSAVYTPNDEDNGKITLIRRDSIQEDTVQELTDTLFSAIEPEPLDILESLKSFEYALDIAAEIYCSFEVLTSNGSQEFDGIAYRNKQLVIIERKNNLGTGPNELQRNFFADKIKNKISFFRKEEIIEERYKIKIGPSNSKIPVENPVIKKAKQLIGQAIKKKNVEFTFNSPKEEDIKYYQLPCPGDFNISLRLAEHSNGVGKGDEKVVKAQLLQTKKNIMQKRSSGLFKSQEGDKRNSNENVDANFLNRSVLAPVFVKT